MGDKPEDLNVIDTPDKAPQFRLQQPPNVAASDGLIEA
jgi:hypothetical protein